MDVTLTEDQKLLRETAQAFAAAALPPARIRALEETEHGFDADVWREMARMGWAGAVFDERYGGAGVGMVELSLIVEALGQSALPSPLFATVIEAGLLLQESGSDGQRNVWLSRIAAGDAILTAAFAEPGGGLSAASTRTTVARSGNGFVVDGTKLFVRDAGRADAIACFGRDGDALTAVLVPRDAPGLTLRRLRAAGGEALWEATFQRVAVDADALIGEVGGAGDALRRLILRGSALKSAELVGIGQAALDLTVSYAKTRHQFGKPIGSFQAVHHHCAEMLRDITVCRLLAWQAVTSLAEDAAAARAVAMAKVKCGEAIPAATRTAHQVHGALAYYRDYPLELHYHRAIAATAAYGDTAHHRRALATLLHQHPDGFRGPDRHELPVHPY